MYKDLVRLDYGIAMIELDRLTYVITNKFMTQSLDLRAGNTLKIEGLGRMEIIGIIRKPFFNSSDIEVQEIKFLCKRV